MTPAKFARDECANLIAPRECLGVSVDSLLDHGQPKTATPRDVCLIFLGKRCTYFERVILPLADDPSPKDDPGLQARRAYARSEYLGLHARAKTRTHPRTPPRSCADCGTPIPPRFRLCHACRAKHQRLAYRRNRARLHHDQLPRHLPH
uniref:Uncharacterized protein n=1 Tax=viral metagenome TaxID=1070528 RepID=A0A6H1ZGV9_9ZZZZ